jgi:4-carboxymuconolactone decarboxylase
MTDDRYEKGLEMRTQVLGSEYVKAATGEPDDIFRPLQELVTESCWGTVWQRRELPLNTRSMLTISMLIARGYEDELGLHIRAGLTNGCTPEEIVEVIVHSAIYCGVPAAISAARVARRVFAAAGE